MTPTEHKAARAIIDYVVNDWPWAEPPPSNVMAALRVLDASTRAAGPVTKQKGKK